MLHAVDGALQGFVLVRSGFHFKVENSSHLLWFYIATLPIGWKKVAQLFYPIRAKTNSRRDSLAFVFPFFRSASRIYFELWLFGSLDCLRLLWLARVVSLVLVSRYLIEKRRLYCFRLGLELLEEMLVLRLSESVFFFKIRIKKAADPRVCLKHVLVSKLIVNHFKLNCKFSFCFVLSSSSLVLKILKDAYNAGKKFRVVVVDSRPKFEGIFKFALLSQYILNKLVQTNFKYLRRFSVIFGSLRSSFGHFCLMTTMTTGCDVSRQRICS